MALGALVAQQVPHLLALPTQVVGVAVEIILVAMLATAVLASSSFVILLIARLPLLQQATLR